MKKIIIFGIVLVIITVGGIISFNILKKPIITYKDNLKVNLNSEVYNNSFIKDIKRGSIKTEQTKIDTSKVGTQTIKLEITNLFKQTLTIEYEIEVIDTVAPVIESEEALTTEFGKEINLLEKVTAKDNNGETIEVKVEGEYNFNKAGTYELYYVATDSSGNTTRKKFTLEVKEKAKEPDPEPEPKTTPTPETKPTTDGEFTTTKGFKGVTKNGITYIDGILIANKTYSLPSTYSPNGLTTETQNAANEMFAAAKLEGLNMWAQSGFRSYATQEKLYNNYAATDGKAAADRYSARPGHSEHQSGLAFDVCQSGYGCINSTFDNTPPANWLAKNAYKYGFILRYPKGKESETGYLYESWHFRYVGKELAQKLYNNGDWITLESYFGITSTYSK